MMRLVWIVFFLLLLLSGISGAWAQAQRQPETVGVKPAGMVPLGYCQLSVTTVVLISTCGGGIPTGAAFAYITTETASIRFRDDGVAPTTTVGTPLSATLGQQLIYSGPLGLLQVVSQSGTAAVSIAFYR